MTGPRLFPDFAAAPTPRERRTARTLNRARQGSMFDHQHDGIPSCDACAGDHATDHCPHGTALEMFT